MAPGILIATMAGDFHAYAVAEALARKGNAPILWLTPDFPSRAMESVSLSNEVREIRIGSTWSAGSNLGIRSLWNRRPRHELFEPILDPADRPFARAQCQRFRNALLEILSSEVLASGGLCVNPWSHCVLGENKLWQHHWAAKVGLTPPDTLYTNEPEAIRRMIDRHGGEIVYKPFAGTLWLDDCTEWGYYTRVIGLNDLVADDLLQAVPGIYQEVVAKDYELRVTVIGSSFFAARVNSQETTQGRTDWRRAYEDLTMEPAEIPGHLKKRCKALLDCLGLVFGCFDFVVTPDGQYVFLEVNPAGQFLFVEEYTNLPLLDAFAEFLLAGQREFLWEDSHDVVRLDMVQEEAARLSRQSLEEHVVSRPPHTDERTGHF